MGQRPSPLSRDTSSCKSHRTPFADSVQEIGTSTQLVPKPLRQVTIFSHVALSNRLEDAPYAFSSVDTALMKPSAASRMTFMIETD